MTKAGDRKLVARAEHLASNERIYGVVLKLLARLEPGRLLDAPSGPGLLSHKVATQGFKPLAADIDKQLFILPWLEYRQIDLNGKLPFKKGQFDCVVCIEGIEHVENQYLLIREFARTIKPGGRLLLTTPNISNLSSRFYALLSGFDSAAPQPLDPATEPPYMEHINPIALPKLEYAMARAGLEIEIVAASHLRKGSILLTVLAYPWLLLAGSWALLRARGRQGRINRRSLQRLLSLPALCGGVLVVQAVKK